MAIPVWSQLMGTQAGATPVAMNDIGTQPQPMSADFQNMITQNLEMAPSPVVPYNNPNVVNIPSGVSDVVDTQRSSVERRPMSQRSFNTQQKFLGKQEKRDMTDREKMLQQINEYMSKREQIAMDTENRLSKLDIQQAAKGPNLSALMAFGDSMARGSVMEGGPSLANTYQATGQAPLTDAELEAMKLKLGGAAAQDYSGLTKDSMNILRQDDMVNQWDQNRLLKNKLAGVKDKGLKPFSGEMVKRLDNITGMDYSIRQMEELTNTGKDQALKTFLSQNTSLAPDTKFGALLRNAAEFYGRMQSGGAIQQAEDRRFIMSMFKPTDNIDMKKYKFNLMKNMLRDRAKSLSYGRDFDSLPSSLQNIIQGSDNTSKINFSDLSEEDLAEAFRLEKEKELRERGGV